MSGAGDSESSISGIVHSVHIRTGGGGDQTPSVTSISPPKRTSNRSVSQSDLLSAAKNEATAADQHGGLGGGGVGVHIEIKNLSKSQDHLASTSASSTGPSPRLKSTSSGISSGGLGGSAAAAAAAAAIGASGSSSGTSRRSNPQGGSVSVINLKQSVDNLPHRASSSGDLAKGRYMSPNR